MLYQKLKTLYKYIEPIFQNTNLEQLLNIATLKVNLNESIPNNTTMNSPNSDLNNKHKQKINKI